MNNERVKERKNEKKKKEQAISRIISFTDTSRNIMLC